MLGSITPLGERGRHQRWGITIAALVIGAIIGGAALGSALAWLGATIGARGGDYAATGLMMAALVGLALDLRLGGMRLPTTRRQVNDGWLYAYRGWVYGFGFGVQLGTGIATIVITSAVYVALLAGLVSGSPLAGLSIGAAFGLVRGLTVVPSRHVREPRDLARMHDRLVRWDRASRLATLVAQAGVSVILMVLVAGL